MFIKILKKKKINKNVNIYLQKFGFWKRKRVSERERGGGEEEEIWNKILKNFLKSCNYIEKYFKHSSSYNLNNIKK